MNRLNSRMSCWVTFGLFLLASCASHTAGRFEIDARRRQAPNAMIADAIRCDTGKAYGCMNYGQWLLPNDQSASTDAMKRACDLGESGACFVVEAGKKYQAK